MDTLASHHSVCAVVPGSAPEVVSAVAAQTVRPADVVRADGSLAAAAAQALDTGAGWIWILDGSAAPRPDALDGLLRAAAAAASLGDPAVISGVVVTAAGRADATRPIWFASDRFDLAMSAATHRLLPIRATAGPALVRRAGAAAAPPRRSSRLTSTAIFEWTSRLLRDAPGYLTTDSESEALHAVRDPLGDPRTVLRLATGGSLRGRDRVVLGYRAARALAGRVSAARDGRPPAGP